MTDSAALPSWEQELWASPTAAISWASPRAAPANTVLTARAGRILFESTGSLSGEKRWMGARPERRRTRLCSIAPLLGRDPTRTLREGKRPPLRRRSPVSCPAYLAAPPPAPESPCSVHRRPVLLVVGKSDCDRRETEPV